MKPNPPIDDYIEKNEQNERLMTAKQNGDLESLCLLLSEGVNPFWGPIHLTIFSLSSYGMKLLDSLYQFEKVWAHVDEKYKTKDNIMALSKHYVSHRATCLDGRIKNCINFGTDQKAFQEAYDKYPPTIESTLSAWQSNPEVYRKLLEKTSAATHMADLSNFNKREAAFLHIHHAAHQYFQMNVELCIEDLKELNKKLLHEWEALHPNMPFPELKIGEDFTLERMFNAYITVSHIETPIKFDRILRAILIRDLKEAGISPSSDNNELSYLKFIGFVPNYIANNKISRSMLLYSEGYTASTSHTHYAHMIQWWLLAKAFNKKIISLTYLDETFTFQEFLSEIFNPKYSTCYQELGMWASLFDLAYGPSLDKKIATSEQQILSLNSPTYLMSIIRQYHDKPEMKALAHYIIISDIKRLNKLRALKVPESRIFDHYPHPFFQLNATEIWNEIHMRTHPLPDNSSSSIEERRSDYMILKKTIPLL